MKRRYYAIALLLSLVLSMQAFSQSSNASLSGTITDASSAMIAGVTVTATSIATGVVNTAASNTVGVYSFPSLLPGTYKVVGEQPGFQTRTYTDVQLGNAAQVRLNFQLQVAGVASCR